MIDKILILGQQSGHVICYKIKVKDNQLFAYRQWSAPDLGFNAFAVNLTGVNATEELRQLFKEFGARD